MNKRSQIAGKTQKSDFDEDRALRYRLVCQVPTSMQFNITTDSSRNLPISKKFGTHLVEIYSGQLFIQLKIQQKI
jgi:ribosomal protein S19